MPNKPKETVSPPWPARRDKVFNVRIDQELYDAAAEKAEDIGVAALVRALLRAYVRDAVEVPPEDMDQELTWAPRLRRARPRPQRK